jgi:hypothetical protein
MKSENSKNNDNESFSEKIQKALDYSYKKLIEDKKRLGQKIVISENGIIKYIEAKDL